MHLAAIMAFVLLIEEVEYWRMITKKIVKSIFMNKPSHEGLSRMVLFNLDIREFAEIFSYVFIYFRYEKLHTPYIYVHYNFLL